MLTDTAAGAGEGIVLPDQADGIFVPAGADQRHVARDVHACGTLGNARHGLIQVAGAASREDMGLIVVPEAADAFEHHLRSLIADGTVCRVRNDLGGGLDEIQRLQRGVPVENVVDQKPQLPQPNAARHAFATRLGVAELQKSRCQIHRAQAWRAGNDAVFQVPVERLHHGLGTAGRIEFQSAHTFPPKK